VNDFKQNKSMRLVGYLEFEEVGPDGAIKHGKLGDQSFPNQARTFARLVTITRQDIINDDLGALSDVPKELGRGSATKLNKVFWTAFLDNTSFFTSGNNNLVTSSPLGVSGLTNAEVAFMKQTQPDGNPLAITPKIILTPSELGNTARALIAPQTEYRDTTANTKFSTGNPHANKDYNVVSTPYLSNSAMGGAYSTTTWYLLAGADDVPVMEVCFLDGNESPVIDTADADFDTLGIQMRGFYDFGVTKMDPRGGVKATA
jgi:phage major head subunit gpT-like protein